MRWCTPWPPPCLRRPTPNRLHPLPTPLRPDSRITASQRRASRHFFPCGSPLVQDGGHIPAPRFPGRSDLHLPAVANEGPQEIAGFGIVAETLVFGVSHQPDIGDGQGRGATMGPAGITEFGLGVHALIPPNYGGPSHRNGRAGDWDVNGKPTGLRPPPSHGG